MYVRFFEFHIVLGIAVPRQSSVATGVATLMDGVNEAGDMSMIYKTGQQQNKEMFEVSSEVCICEVGITGLCSSNGYLRPTLAESRNEYLRLPFVTSPLGQSASKNDRIDRAQTTASSTIQWQWKAALETHTPNAVYENRRRQGRQELLVFALINITFLATAHGISFALRPEISRKTVSFSIDGPTNAGTTILSF